MMQSTMLESAGSRDVRQDALAKTNPLFGKRRLKLGTFCTNVSNAATMSSMDGVYKLNWPNVAIVSELADAMDFEAIVPIARKSATWPAMRRTC